ncbi:hypothetical protein VCRA2116O29_120014 [Vibrio crassostreae]|nr:hypothetical protein VCRA2119O382_20149 [Vibrio crassostreae]CAK2014400.1 hypothetical protein VCRA2117O380_20343 [Vibrio crassostreae]CAK2158754.1 hypothetical protein VCRA2119O381_640002 [Vibrio crassostreae]CAK2399350.1 hypothetical protein VCRA2116O29_120014 [Vibrio crassostreae]CAK2483638.1 hypothetical protein VCRA2113O350_20343 [Vibrio crassostreae]
MTALMCCRFKIDGLLLVTCYLLLIAYDLLPVLRVVRWEVIAVENRTH